MMDVGCQLDDNVFCKVRVNSTILDLGTKWWEVSFTFLLLHPRRNRPRHPLYRRLGWPQKWSGSCGEPNLHTDWATMACDNGLQAHLYFARSTLHSFCYPGLFDVGPVRNSTSTAWGTNISASAVSNVSLSTAVKPLQVKQNAILSNSKAL
jgi:hypothetical protein